MVIYFLPNDVDLIDTNKITVETFFDLYFGELFNFKIRIFRYSGSSKKLVTACEPLTFVTLWLKWNQMNSFQWIHQDEFISLSIIINLFDRINIMSTQIQINCNLHMLLSADEENSKVCLRGWNAEKPDWRDLLTYFVS